MSGFLTTISKPFYKDHTSYGATLGFVIPVLVGFFLLIKREDVNIRFLMLLLIAEGIGYGLYFTIGQTMLTSYAGVASLGAAMGTFSMMTGIGGSLLPFFLGIAADGFGLASIYYLTGLLLIAGVIFLITVSRASTAKKVHR